MRQPRARRLLVTTIAALCLASAILGAWPRPVPFHTQARLSGDAPRRIISLVPALTEMLFAIGAGPQVIAVSSFDRFPEEATSRPTVGALLDPDVERILSLTPDLVAVYGSQTDLKGQLQRASIPVYDYRHAGLPDILTTLRDLGRRTGHTAEAETVAARIERQLDAVHLRTSAAPRVRTLLVFGREPGSLRNVYVAGGKGFLHDMLTAAGGENVFADVAQESVQATTELILARAPDAILEVREGPALGEAQARQRTADWSHLASVPAVRAKRVYIVSGTGLVVPGPRVAAAVERFARTLHPERFAR